MSIADEKNINIFAASSLKPALDKIFAKFRLHDSHSSLSINLVYGSSSSLSRQIERGAPADIFISASESWMNYLIKNKIVWEDDVEILVSNDLVVATSIENFSFDNFLNSGNLTFDKNSNINIAMGLTKSVPIGIYGKQALDFYQIWDDYRKYIVEYDDASKVIRSLQLGECEIAIVYKSDISHSSEGFTYYIFPVNSHDPINYVIAKTYRGREKNVKIEQTFNFLLSDTAQQIFIQYGFNKYSSHFDGVQ